MLPAGTFADDVVLVTGGGTGLGKAMAERFLGLGAEIAICGRRKGVCDATAAELLQVAVGTPLLAVDRGFEQRAPVAGFGAS